jgi:tellurite resistance protein TehA-like permease
MKKFISNIPAPITGLGLGLASLGTVMTMFFPTAGTILKYMACMVALIYFLKVLLHPKAFLNDLKHPVFSSIVPTFSMTLMILSTFIAQWSKQIGEYIWLIAIVLHALLFINFITLVLKDKKFSNIIPSYFIPPVGIAVACVSGKMFNYPQLCQAILYFGLGSYLITLILVMIRIFKEEIPKPKQTTIAIMAAPASLCLASYLTISNNPSPTLLYILVPLSIVMTLYVYFKIPNLLKIPFNPGYSALTFPLVISAIAMLKFATYLANSSNSWAPYVKQFGVIELGIAIAMVMYVTLRNVHFLTIMNKSKQ